ncbi:MAG: SCO family protein [Lentisphaeria bacterium]|nr:SCO family protein [Lentisphaeria bacterium]
MKISLFRLLLIISTSYITFGQGLKDFDKIGIDDKLGETLPLNLEFTDENGKKVKLSDVINGERPIILTLAYYECPMLCTQVLNGVADSIRTMPFQLGKEYELITVSIDPGENPELSRLKRDAYGKNLGKDLEGKWHFWTGNQKNIDVLSNALGFRYFYDEDRDEYMHAACVYLVDPEGKLTLYFPRFVITERDMRLGLMEASNGKVGTVLDQFLHYCFYYDSDKNSYVGFALWVKSLSGALTLVVLGLFIGWLIRLEISRKKVIESEQET